MATLAQLRRKVIRAIHDLPYAPEDIDFYINESIQVTAESVLLPMLESTKTIQTVENEYVVDFPVDWNFGRNLYSVVAEQGPVKVYSSLALFMREYSRFQIDKFKGPVEAVTKMQDQLVYYHIPEIPDTLICSFYIKPPFLVNDDDSPDCIPIYLHNKLLVSYACAELLEDTDNKQQVPNTEMREGFVKKYKNKFYLGLEELAHYTREGQSRMRPVIGSDWI
jgi:hypothetical protein